MNTRFLLATLAGSFVLLPVGFLLYGVVFAFLFDEGALKIPGVMKESPRALWIVAGQVAFGTLLALMIRWRGATTLRGGAETGAILGFLMAAGYDFAQYGTSNLWTATATLVDPLISAVLVASAGATIGFLLGRGNPPPTRRRQSASNPSSI